MAGESISDNRVHAFLRKQLRQQPGYIQQELRALTFCGSRNMMLPDKSVAVISNGDSSKLVGNIFCHSIWACPRCTAKEMAKVGNKIACALDAMKRKGKAGFMMTFTIPHTHGMRCDEVFQILHDTWHLAHSRAPNKQRVKTHVWKTTDELSKHAPHKNTHGEVHKKSTYFLNSRNGLGRLKQELQIRHFVKMIEFTWGNNGWHPHIHSIWWVNRKQLQDVAKYEDAICECWWIALKQVATKFWTQKFGDKAKAEAYVEQFYNDRKKINDEHKTVWISKDKYGRILETNSSHYISGWGGDQELTGQGNTKKAKKGHYTPFQLLEEGMKNPADADKWVNLFLEYARATRGQRRTAFAHGLNDIIKEWQETETYITSLKKKFMDKGQKPYHLVTWFKSQQWSEILLIEYNHDYNIIPKILELARLPDGAEQIANLLKQYDIDISGNGPHKHEAEILGNRLLNKLLAA